MLQSIYTGRMGLSAQQTRMDVLSNNIANINTYGFMNNRVDFKDALYGTMKKPIQPQNDVNLELGTGLLPTTLRIFGQGALIMSKRDLDVAIQGEGFFEAVNPQGDKQYTRNGVFHLSVENGDLRYLTTSQGYYVLDVNGERIPLREEDVDDVSISPKGEISIGRQPPFATLALYTFKNREGLSAVGDNAFMPSETSGEAEPAGAFELVQGYLENSNVDLAQEMTRMIRSQRALQMAARVVTTTDNMEDTAITIRG